MVIGRSTFPIFLFGYGNDEQPVNPDRPDKPFLMAAAPKSSLAASPLQNALTITDFAVDGVDAVSGAVEAVVIDRATGKTLASSALAGQTVTVYGAGTPAGPWKKIAVLRAGEKGEWLVDRVRSCKYFKIGLVDGI